MQIGAMNHPARDPLEEINWIGHHGFDFVDFTFEPPATAPTQVDTAAIRSALAHHQLHVVAHTAYYLPVASPFASIREACLSELRQALQASRQIGAEVMNMHFDKPPSFFSEEQTIDWHEEVMQPLCDDARRFGMTVVVEHIPFGGSNQLEMIRSLLKRVPLLQFHLDSGHAKLERSYDRWDEYLDQLGERLRHVHLSENDGTADQHLPLGSAPRSTTSWRRHIRKLKECGYDGTITLEVFSPHKQHLLTSRDLLKSWWYDD